MEKDLADDLLGEIVCPEFCGAVACKTETVKLFVLFSL